MNAKEELLSILNGKAQIKCATIYTDSWIDGMDRKDVILKLNYTEEDYKKFLENLDFTYDEGYGGQELYGTVWLEDGTWLSRGEYDGSEWWEHNVLPIIPGECL